MGNNGADKRKKNTRHSGGKEGEGREHGVTGQCGTDVFQERGAYYVDDVGITGLGWLRDRGFGGGIEGGGGVRL